jgi:hypothetical protein
MAGYSVFASVRWPWEVRWRLTLARARHKPAAKDPDEGLRWE